MEAVSVGWDVDAVLSLTRDRFGPKGPLELRSELLIQQASLGDREAVCRTLRSGSVHPDVGDSQGNTALIAATVNCHNEVIHLLLDMGADINKLNSEGVSALAACHVLYYPHQSLHSVGQRTVNQTSQEETTSLNNRPNRPQISNTVMGGHTTSLTSHSDRTTEELTEQRPPGHISSNGYHDGDPGVFTDIHDGRPGDTTTTTTTARCLEEQERERGGKRGEKKTEKKGEDNGGEVVEEREIEGKEEQRGKEEREREEGGKRIITDGVGRGGIEQEREVEEREKAETDLLLGERREMEAGEEDEEQGAGERGRRAVGQRGEDGDEREEEEERGDWGGCEERGGKEGFLQVLDGHISLGSVSWLEGGASASNIVQRAAGEQCDTPASFDSAHTLHSFPLQVTEEAMQCTAEAMSRAGIAHHSTHTQETVRKMAAMKTEHRARWSTLQLLLERGADPNASRTPMPVLFLPIMAAHTEAVRKLLLCGARTDIPLPPERKGLYPLHMAAALPGPEGPSITELLLHAVADVDAQALDQGDIYHLDMPSAEAQQAMQGNNKTPKAPPGDPHAAFGPLISQPPVEGGRTALHVACQRESDYSHARDVVSLLLSHRASTHLLWSGHSPLSLAIASGNNLAVEELLKAGADPNLPLGHRVGSALCALANIHYDSGGHPRNRAKLLNMLVTAGANILMPVIVGEGRRSALGTAVDYAHHTFNQDVRVARTPYHTLNRQERETFNARRQLLSMMGDLLRQSAAVHRDEAEEPQPSLAETSRNQSFKFCYRCGRSVSVLLTACSRCHQVFYCSKTCKLKAWNEGHKNECIRTPGRSAKVAQVSLVEQMATDPKQKRCQKTQRPGLKLVQMTGTRQHAGLKIDRTPRPLSMAQKVSESHRNLKENYSFE